MIAKCNRCGAQWTGASLCHCTGCHETFTSIQGFDKHRSGGKCTPPSKVRVGTGVHAGKCWFSRNERGHWAHDPHAQRSFPVADNDQEATKPAAPIPGLPSTLQRA